MGQTVWHNNYNYIWSLGCFSSKVHIHTHTLVMFYTLEKVRSGVAQKQLQITNGYTICDRKS